MKYRIFTIIVIVISLFCLTAGVVGYEYNITPGDNFVWAHHDDDLSIISKKLNMSSDALSNYFNQNGLVYLAISNDNKSQIKLSAFTDNFSSAAGDMSNLDDKTISEFASSVGENNDNTAHVIINNGRKFVCVKSTREDSGGLYTITQYITICNNKTFYFAGYNAGNDTSDEILSAFNSFEIHETETPNYTLPIALIIAGIVLFTAIAIFMIVGIIKIINNSEKSGDENV